jgi:hypothetical protein
MALEEGTRKEKLLAQKAKSMAIIDTNCRRRKAREPGGQGNRMKFCLIWCLLHSEFQPIEFSAVVDCWEMTEGRFPIPQGEGWGEGRSVLAPLTPTLSPQWVEREWRAFLQSTSFTLFRSDPKFHAIAPGHIRIQLFISFHQVDDQQIAFAVLESMDPLFVMSFNAEYIQPLMVGLTA